MEASGLNQTDDSCLHEVSQFHGTRQPDQKMVGYPLDQRKMIPHQKLKPIFPFHGFTLGRFKGSTSTHGFGAMLQPALLPPAMIQEFASSAPPTVAMTRTCRSSGSSL
jgi:hypothetical protein